MGLFWFRKPRCSVPHHINMHPECVQTAKTRFKFPEDALKIQTSFKGYRKCPGHIINDKMYAMHTMKRSVSIHLWSSENESVFIITFEG